MTGTATAGRARLSMQRTARAERDGARVLGGFAFDAEAPPDLLALGARVLGGSPRYEWWCTDGPIERGRRGPWHWRRSGGWLWADCRARGDDLEALTRSVYRELFALLDEQGLPQLQRVWNYLRDINADERGLERYRHFNSGRQQAFLDAERSAFAGAPAACALGLAADAADDLCISVLAAADPAIAIENPRQVSAYDYPRDYGPRSPSFSRAARVRLGSGADALLISGTASIVGHQSLHAGDATAQVREILVNLQALLQAAQRSGDRRRRLGELTPTVYLRRAQDLDAVRGTFESAVGRESDAARQAVYLQADICRGDLLVEIEAHCT